MEIEDEIKTKNAELIVRFLAKDENYGKKFTPNTISNTLEENGTKIYGRKIEKILAMFALACKDIFGFEKLTNFSFYWIKVDKKNFKMWFEDWFNVKL